jgi:hypothetical protein
MCPRGRRPTCEGVAENSTNVLVAARGKLPPQKNNINIQNTNSTFYQVILPKIHFLIYTIMLD